MSEQTPVVLERRISRVWGANPCSMAKVDACLGEGRRAIVRVTTKEEGRPDVSIVHLCGACCKAMGDLPV